MCDKCEDMGFYLADVPLGHPNYGKAMPCSCTLERRKERAQRKLLALDGLTNQERLHTFASTTMTPAQQPAAHLLATATCGIYTLQGPPGTGKSHLLHCAVNQARAEDRVAVYTTMPDLLDYLRAAFNPRQEEPYTERWELLIHAAVLALDELDEFNATDWARERFLRLIDERWRKRDETLTLVALNGAVDALPGKIASRLYQGRVVKMQGADMRRVFADPVLA